MLQAGTVPLEGDLRKARGSSAMEIVEIPGDQFPSLEAAQEAALPSLVRDLADTIRRLMAERWIINVNGEIIPNPERIRGNEP